MDLDDYLTTQEAGKELGYSASYIRLLIDEGRLEARKMGRTWLIHRDALKRIKPAARPVGRPKKPN